MAKVTITFYTSLMLKSPFVVSNIVDGCLVLRSLLEAAKKKGKGNFRDLQSHVALHAGFQCALDALERHVDIEHAVIPVFHVLLLGLEVIQKDSFRFVISEGLNTIETFEGEAGEMLWSYREMMWSYREMLWSYREYDGIK